MAGTKTATGRTSPKSSPGTNQPKPWNYWDKVQVQTPVLEWDAGNTVNNSIDNGNGFWNTLVLVPVNAPWRPNLGTFGALEPPAPGNLNSVWVNGRDAALGVGNSTVTINELSLAGAPAAVQVNTLTTYANTQIINAAAVGNDLDLIGRTMNISGDAVINAVLTSSTSKGLAKYGPSTLTLTHDNTLVGQTSLFNGVTVLQNNAGATVGRLTNVTNVLLQQGATLRIDNTVGIFQANENNRIFGGAQEACFLRMAAGTFDYKGRNVAPGSNEGIFMLSLEDGGSKLVINNPAVATNTVVRFMNFQRFPAATLTVDTTPGVGTLGGGAGSPMLVFPNPLSQPTLVIGAHVGGFTPPTNGIGIVPYMVVNTPAGLDFATYTAAGSPLVTPYTYLPGPWPAAQEIDPGFPPGLGLPWNNTTSADYNVLVTNATFAPLGVPFLNNNHVINSLKIKSGAPTVNIGGFILSLYSGGMIMENGTVLTDLVPSPNSFLTAGGFVPGNAAELVVHVPAAATATISSRIGDNAEQGQVSLVKSAPGTLVLSPPVIPGTPWNNSYTGKTYINEGVLQVAADDLGAWGRFGPVPGPGSDLRIQCGELYATNSFLLTRDVWFDGRAPYQQGLDKSNAGTIRIADSMTLVIPTDAMQGAVAPIPRMSDGMVRLTSDYTPTGAGNPGPATPLLNGTIDVQTRQVNLIASNPNQPFGDTIMLEDVVIHSAADCALNFPLGQARLYVVAGSRATTPLGFISGGIGGENNNVTRLNLTSPNLNKTLPNTIVLPDALNHFYIDGGSGSTVLLNGDMERQNYNARVGEIVTANDTKLILDRQNQCNYSGAAGVGAASGEIEVRTANYWLGILDNRGLNHLGIVTGARAQGDRNQNPANLRAHTVWFRNNFGGGPADGQFYYSTLVSESQAFNIGGIINGPKVPLTLDVDLLANVNFTGNASGGSVLTCYDDLVKTGLGTLTLFFSGNTSATQVATKANNATFDIQMGTVVFQDTKDAAGNYLPLSSAGAPGSSITDCLFDGGNDNPQGIAANGVLKYIIQDKATLSAQFGTNTSGGGHTMHFDLTLNPGTLNGIATIQVGDTFAAGQSRQPMTIGNAPSYTGFSSPALNWTGYAAEDGAGRTAVRRHAHARHYGRRNAKHRHRGGDGRGKLRPVHRLHLAGHPRGRAEQRHLQHRHRYEARRFDRWLGYDQRQRGRHPLGRL